MTTEVQITLPDGHQHTLRVAEPAEAMAARTWLDAEFTRLDCVPSGVGKVFTAEKLLAVAREAGTAGFADAAWAAQYARVAAAMLNKPLVRVDLGADTISY